jgi:hypothetical protein
VREDAQSKGLLFAGTELGVYVSFDDGDHWQSLQLNLPVSSIRDLAIHGDDVVVATHGRSFWILDDITPLRQALEAGKANEAWLYHPAAAFRIDNDSFPGTPLPPEEPTAENPPSGAVIDYFLKTPASNVKLEIFDAQQNLVRKFSSDDQGPGKHRPLPVAERWFPKPEVIEKSPGMHRFVWNLAWASAGGPSADDEAEYRNPSGPKAVPGIYQVRLTVDGKMQSQPLEVIMDPRSEATRDSLEQQFQLGQKIFAEVQEARRVLAEISVVQKQLADMQKKLGDENPTMKAALAETQAEIGRIVSNKEAAQNEHAGLQEAFTGLTSALRAVENGDRAVPSQVIAVYDESSARVKARMAEWTAFKQTKLPALNQKLREGKLAPIAISEIEEEAEFLMSR